MSYEIIYDMSIPGRGNLTQKRYIIAHESGNPNNTARGSIDSEVMYMKANQNAANVTHWVGADKNGNAKIVQLAPVGKVSWGCVDANPYSYAQVELARANNQADFNTGYRAYVWLLRMLATEAGLPVNVDSSEDRGIKTHYWCSMSRRFNTNHTDPYAYLASFGISKAQFQYDITNGIGGTANVPVNSTSTVGTTYTVKSGDTLYKISKNNGLTVDALKSLNGLTSNLLKIGQVLKLKATATVKPAPTVVATPKPVTNSINWIAESGTFYPNTTLNVRSEPNDKAEIVAQYHAGQSVTYNAKWSDGYYTWIRYTGGSGLSRYMVSKINGVRTGTAV